MTVTPAKNDFSRLPVCKKRVTPPPRMVPPDRGWGWGKNAPCCIFRVGLYGKKRGTTTHTNEGQKTETKP